MNDALPLLIGIALALAVSAYAAWIGLDKDRAFYPAVLLVVASYYVLFSVMGANTRTTIQEILLAMIFLLAASIGFRRNLWIVAAAIAAHAILDAFHGAVVSNPGVPAWWPAFCSAFDLTAAAFLAFVLRRAPARSRPRDRASE
ncbi:MAG: hypothetical protein ABI889_11325 [Gemmatimonadota bacterium]